MNRQTVVVSGGMLDEEFTLEILKSEETEYIVAADHGLEFLYKHGINPDYIVGDFDSTSDEIVNYYRTETKVPIRQFNPVKDASDTEIAIRLAMTLGASEIYILGATGGRIDHLWANVQTLTIPFKAGVDTVILDSQNKIRLIGGDTVIRREDAYGPYFSIFPLGQEIYSLSIKGAKYPLHDHKLTPYDSLCVSNQFAEEEVKITFGSGIVILMETRDKK